MENHTNIPDDDLKQLHQDLAQIVINFFKEKGLPDNVWMLTFSFDDLKSSVKAGEWIPYSDSSMELWDNHKNCLAFEM